MTKTKEKERKRQEALETVRALSSNFTNIGIDIGELVTQKNKAYGDSFNQAEKIIQILYPNGVQANQYNDFLTIIRVIDKLFRVATDKDAFGESPWRDIAGYSVLAVERNERGIRDAGKILKARSESRARTDQSKPLLSPEEMDAILGNSHEVDKVTRQNTLAAMLKEKKVDKETNTRSAEQERQNEIDAIGVKLVDDMDLEQIAHP